MEIYNAFEIVLVPFPFTDSSKSKKRPAIILSNANSFNNISGHSIMAMITSSNNNSWPLDVPINDLKQAGLPNPSIIRMKFFTLDHRFIIKTIGSLSVGDKKELIKNLKVLINY